MSEVTEYVSSGNGHQNWHKVDGRYKSSIQDSILNYCTYLTLHLVCNIKSEPRMCMQKRMTLLHVCHIYLQKMSVNMNGRNVGSLTPKV